MRKITVNGAEKMKKLFFCYNFSDKDIVLEFYLIISKYPDCEIYFFDNMIHERSWEEDIKKAIQECDYFLLFMGKEYGNTQKKEVELFEGFPENNRGNQAFIKIELVDYNAGQFIFLPTQVMGTIQLKPNDQGIPDIFSCSRDLMKHYLNLKFNFCDNLPSNPHLFDYEKTIIDFYISKEQLYNRKRDDLDHLTEEEIAALFVNVFMPSPDIRKYSLEEKRNKIKEKYSEIHKKLSEGCPPKWPMLKPKREGVVPNELKEFGKFRPHDASVVAAALSKYHHPSGSFCMIDSQLIFPEAGPREELYFPKYSRNLPNTFRVAVLVSGGIAPGINAVIDGITQRHFKYFEKEMERNPTKRLEIWGLRNGFQAFNNLFQNIYMLKNKEDAPTEGRIGIPLVTSDHVNEGGSILGTSRYEPLLFGEKRESKLEEFVQKLKDQYIRILYIIGGDGSMKAAHAISYIAQKKYEDEDWNLSVIGIPKTMDNDILWVWQTFGFLSAVEKAREFIDHLAVEIKSNPRLGVVQLFGSDSGFVVSHAVLASRTGICDIALIPEVPFSMKVLARSIKEKLEKKDGYYGLIVMAETAIPTDALDYLDYIDRIPEYINASLFDNHILPNLSADHQKEICQFYQSNEGKYELVKNINLNEEEKIRNILEDKNLRFINYVNFTHINCEDFTDIKKKLSGEEFDMLNQFYEGRPKSRTLILNEDIKDKDEEQLRRILNSIGYYNYIDIELSKDEKLAIIEYIKLKNQNKRIQGQTKDSLRTAGLKIVCRGIQKYWGTDLRVLSSEPRHLIRAIPPSTSDIIIGSRLGTLAVDNAMAGYTDFMISQWLTEYVLVPLKLVVLGRKRIPESGVFWKSVLAKTGQLEKMV